MTNPYIERAAKVMALDHQHPARVVGFYDGLAMALDSAGLLRTPLDERALEACEALHRSRHDSCAGWHDRAIDCEEIGRESLALKEKAKGAAETYSYAIAPTGDADQHWSVLNEQGEAVYMGPKSQARRVAAALNEGDES